MINLAEIDIALQDVPALYGWIGAAIGAVASLVGSKKKKAKHVARSLSQDEKDIISRMEELAVGNEELGQRYADFTKRAISGEKGFSPGLEKDLADQQAKLGERAEALGLSRGGTAAAQATSEFESGADVARGTARDEMMQLGEQLMTARTARMTGAAGTALAPLAEQRGQVFESEVQKQASRAAEKAGLIRTAGQIGSALATSRSKTPSGGGGSKAGTLDAGTTTRAITA